MQRKEFFFCLVLALVVLKFYQIATAFYHLSTLIDTTSNFWLLYTLRVQWPNENLSTIQSSHQRFRFNVSKRKWIAAANDLIGHHEIKLKLFDFIALRCNSNGKNKDYTKQFVHRKMITWIVSLTKCFEHFCEAISIAAALVCMCVDDREIVIALTFTTCF